VRDREVRDDLVECALVRRVLRVAGDDRLRQPDERLRRLRPEVERRREAVSLGEDDGERVEPSEQRVELREQAVVEPLGRDEREEKRHVGGDADRRLVRASPIASAVDDRSGLGHFHDESCTEHGRLL